MRIYRYIGHWRNSAAPTKRTVSPTIPKAQRKRSDSGAMHGPPSSTFFHTVWPPEANTAAGSPLDLGAPAATYIS